MHQLLKFKTKYKRTVKSFCCSLNEMVLLACLLHLSQDIPISVLQSILTPQNGCYSQQRYSTCLCISPWEIFPTILPGQLPSGLPLLQFPNPKGFLMRLTMHLGIQSQLPGDQGNLLLEDSHEKSMPLLTGLKPVTHNI